MRHVAERRSRSPWPARVGVLLIGAAAGAALATVLWAGLGLHRTTVLARVAQPTSVRYDDGSYQVVLRQSRPFGAPVIGGTSYRFWVTRAGNDGYGHSVGVDIDGVDRIDRSSFTVTWERTGVRIRMRSAHELFIPATSFTGGR